MQAGKCQHGVDYTRVSCYRCRWNFVIRDRERFPAYNGDTDRHSAVTRWFPILTEPIDVEDWKHLIFHLTYELGRAERCLEWWSHNEVMPSKDRDTGKDYVLARMEWAKGMGFRDELRMISNNDNHARSAELIKELVRYELTLTVIEGAFSPLPRKQQRVMLIPRKKPEILVHRAPKLKLDGYQPTFDIDRHPPFALLAPECEHRQEFHLDVHGCKAEHGYYIHPLPKPPAFPPNECADWQVVPLRSSEDGQPCEPPSAEVLARTEASRSQRKNDGNTINPNH